MVHGSTNKKFEKNTRRLSPTKDSARKNAVNTTNAPEKNILKTKSSVNKRAALQEPSLLDDQELLTPEFILSSYARNKSSSYNSTPKRSTSLEDYTNAIIKTPDHLTPTKPKPVGILELLSKRDNPQTLANGASKAVDDQETSHFPAANSKISPPVTPKKTNNNERFAGLSNSPAPNTLPLPSFSLGNQELSNPSSQLPDLSLHKAASTPAVHNPSNPRKPNSMPIQSSKPKNKQRRPSPPTRLFPASPPVSLAAPVAVLPSTSQGNGSPPSNPHLDSMTNHLRIMLNIVPAQS